MTDDKKVDEKATAPKATRGPKPVPKLSKEVHDRYFRALFEGIPRGYPAAGTTEDQRAEAQAEYDKAVENSEL